MSKLFTPLSIHDLKLKNRIVMSPVSQYSAQDGYATEKHFEHYKFYAAGGPGAIIQEATIVSLEGRISTSDLGIWKDDHIEYLTKLATIMQQEKCVPGIQLTHAGQKSIQVKTHYSENNKKHKNTSWSAMSPFSFLPNGFNVQLLEEQEIQEIILQFKEAAKRAIKAGYKIIELHASHGYLIHQFLSPLTNKRKDKYGGSIVNRTRILLEIVDAIKPELDSNHSLWVRIAATEWIDKGWSLSDSIELATMLKNRGVDVIDIIPGDSIPYSTDSVRHNHHILFAHAIKKDNNIMTGISGSIIDAKQAEEILNKNQTDIILLGTHLIKNPDFVKNARSNLN